MSVSIVTRQTANLPCFWQVGNLPHVEIWKLFIGQALKEGDPLSTPALPPDQDHPKHARTHPKREQQRGDLPPVQPGERFPKQERENGSDEGADPEKFASCFRRHGDLRCRGESGNQTVGVNSITTERSTQNINECTPKRCYKHQTK